MSSFNIKKEDQEFVLLYMNKHLKTPKGKIVRHQLKSFVEAIIEELNLIDEIQIHDQVVKNAEFLGLYHCYSIQHDTVLSTDERIATMNREFFLTLFSTDYTLKLITGDRKGIEDQINNFKPVIGWLETVLNLNLEADPVNIEIENPRIESTQGEEGVNLLDDGARISLNPRFFTKVEEAYRGLRPEERTVAYLLSNQHEGGILFPMVFAQGRCTPEEYAKGLRLSCTLFKENLLRAVTADSRSRLTMNEIIAQEMRDDAKKLAYYLSCYQEEPITSIMKTIQSGESSSVEFKSTLRRNLKRNTDDPKVITFMCLKTIAAFLNSDGGELFIGVSDSSEILGISQDKFNSQDAFLQYLSNNIKESFERGAISLINSEIIEIEGKYICRVRCKKGMKPTFLNYKKEGEKFFIRNGPSTIELTIRQYDDYIRTHF